MTTPRQGSTPAPSLLTSLDNAKRRQSAAAGCALYALRGCAAAGTGKALAGSPKPFTRRTNKAARSLTRRTTSAASAANGGKVPLPGAHANAPPGGVRTTSTGKASVGLHNHLRGAQIRPQSLLRGAQQARPAQRAEVFRNRTGLCHRRGGPGDVRDVPRSHPQIEGPLLTTLRAPYLFLRSSKAVPPDAMPVIAAMTSQPKNSRVT